MEEWNRYDGGDKVGEDETTVHWKRWAEKQIGIPEIQEQRRTKEQSIRDEEIVWGKTKVA